MKKSLLYIAPDHLEFYKVLLIGFERYSNYEVTLVISNSFKYKYKNFLERILNVFLKFFLNKNLKVKKFNEHFSNIINQFEKFDVLIMNRSDMFTPELLKLVTSKSEFSIVNFWDSFEKIKGQKETIPFFDICYSFDKKDCENYNLKKNNNFYFDTNNNNDNPDYNIFFLGTYDKRIEILNQIISVLEKEKVKVNALLFSKNKKIIQKLSSDSISFFSKTIPFEESFMYNKNTKIILDIAHDNQDGLSFRPFEALGLKKKLITTNTSIKEYDFYNPKNIFIWTKETLSIPKSFFEDPYEDISENIFLKYSLKNWVNEILPK